MCDCHVIEVMQPLWPAEMNRSLGGLESGFLKTSFCHSTLTSIVLMVISIWESDSSNTLQAILRKWQLLSIFFMFFVCRIIAVHIAISQVNRIGFE